MKKAFSVIGIIIGALIIALGMYIIFVFEIHLGGSFEGNSTSSYKFGADFYTEEYAATKNAADNINELGDFAESTVNSITRMTYDIKNLVGIFVSLLGGIVICFFFCKLDESNDKRFYKQLLLSKQESPKEISNQLPEL